MKVWMVHKQVGFPTLQEDFRENTCPDILITMTTPKKTTHCASEVSTEVSTRDYTVAIYYWPNFHRDLFHQSKKWQGWTEWEIVQNAKPEFEGHRQPLVPLWGYRDESDPKEMARSVDAMADAGIGAIIFDWYRYDDDINGGMMIEDALKKGFLQATNRNRVKFALMWANHTYIDCHPFAPGKSFQNAEVWRKGEVSRSAFERITQDAIQTYFKQPNYWKIDGCPYFSIYELDKLVNGLGGLAATQAALDDFRTRVKAAGFPDLHLNLVDWGFSQLLTEVKGQPFPGEPSRKIETLSDLTAALHADSSTMYTWVHHLWEEFLQRPSGQPAAQTPPKIFGPLMETASESHERKPVSAQQSAVPKSVGNDGSLTETTILENAARAGLVAVDYAQYGQRAMQLMDERPAALGVPYFPHVSVGWDGSPRNYPSGIVLNTTPEKWAGFLSQTKAWMDLHPECRGIVTLNSWNEWVEGSYIEPDTVNGTKYLDAVRDVFGASQKEK